MASRHKSNKVQTTVTDYHLFVLQGLINIQGRSLADVLSYMMTSYIEKNNDLLVSSGLTVKDWQESKKK